VLWKEPLKETEMQRSDWGAGILSLFMGMASSACGSKADSAPGTGVEPPGDITGTWTSKNGSQTEAYVFGGDSFRYFLVKSTLPADVKRSGRYGFSGQKRLQLDGETCSLDGSSLNLYLCSSGYSSAVPLELVDAKSLRIDGHLFEKASTCAAVADFGLHDNGIGGCVESGCTQGYLWSEKSKKCWPECMAGYRWDSEADRCILQTDCTTSIIPSNGGNGFVTDFGDFSAIEQKWGTWGPANGLHGEAVGSCQDRTVAVTVDPSESPHALHLTTSIAGSDFSAAVVLRFFGCATVASFSRIQFDINGSAPGLTTVLQIITYDRLSISQGGGCAESAGSGCSTYPIAVGIVDLARPVTKTVTLSLDAFGLDAQGATKVAGLAWGFVKTNSSGDSCTVDVSITNVRFLP
jgi:hypothetical protein